MVQLESRLKWHKTILKNQLFAPFTGQKDSEIVRSKENEFGIFWYSFGLTDCDCWRQKKMAFPCRSRKSPFRQKQSIFFLCSVSLQPLVS